MSSFLRSDDHAHSEGTDATQLEETKPGPSHAALGKSGNAAVGRIIQSGNASYYGTSTRAQKKAHHGGDGFVGQKQANGKPLDPHAMTAAHKTLPLGTEVTVMVTSTGKSQDVTITDRGPYEPGRILDGTVAVAEKLGYKDAGFTAVTLHEKKK